MVSPALPYVRSVPRLEKLGAAADHETMNNYTKKRQYSCSSPTPSFPSLPDIITPHPLRCRRSHRKARSNHSISLPQNHMFTEMRSALHIPKSTDILTHITSLSAVPDHPPDQTSPRSRATASIQTIERRAMTQQVPQPGLAALMAYLTRRRVPKALCTRNFPAPVFNLLGNHLPDEAFHPIITRDTAGVAPKPSPEGLWECARAWLESGDDDGGGGSSSSSSGGSLPHRRRGELAVAIDVDDALVLARRTLGAGMIMVGDSLDDMAAAHRAGAASVLLVNEQNEALAAHEYTDVVIGRLDELIEILEGGFVAGEAEWRVGVTGQTEERAEAYEVKKR